MKFNKSKLKFISAEYFHAYSSRVQEDFVARIKQLNAKEILTSDFDYYIVASSLYSSRIEGNTLDLNSFYRNRNLVFRKKEVKEIENLADAYKFASVNKLTEQNFLKTHTILSKTIVPLFHRGKYRKNVMHIYDTSSGHIVYTAIEWQLVPETMQKVFADINYLLKVKLSVKEIFYYASMLHLLLAFIHPFQDGNGRSARLLEKWFLAEKLGKNSWSVNSEKYYWDNRAKYYKNIALGINYYEVKWGKCIPFLLMLPKSLIVKP